MLKPTFSKTLKMFKKLIIVSFAVATLMGCANSSGIDTTELQTSILHSINTTEANNMITEKKPTIIDVRTPEEFSAGHLDNAINIDVNSPNFTEEIAKLDKNEEYLVYCRSGRRSLVAADIMKAEGFTTIYNMEGGYNEWSASN